MIIKVKHWSFVKTLRVRRRSRNGMEIYTMQFRPTPAPLLCSKTMVYRDIYFILLIFAQNIDFGYLLESPHRGIYNSIPSIYVLSKNITIFPFYSL